MEKSTANLLVSVGTIVKASLKRIPSLFKNHVTKFMHGKLFYIKYIFKQYSSLDVMS